MLKYVLQTFNCVRSLKQLSSLILTPRLMLKLMSMQSLNLNKIFKVGNPFYFFASYLYYSLHMFIALPTIAIVIFVALPTIAIVIFVALSCNSDICRSFLQYRHVFLYLLLLPLKAAKIDKLVGRAITIQRAIQRRRQCLMLKLMSTQSLNLNKIFKVGNTLCLIFASLFWFLFVLLSVQFGII